jgi:hypothetical protein
MWVVDFTRAAAPPPMHRPMHIAIFLGHDPHV